MPSRRRYSNEEVQEFLTALEGQAREILQVSEMAAREATKHSYDLYNNFRSKVSEFETFSIIIDGRLKAVDSERRHELQLKFDQLSVLILNQLITTSIKFFFVLSATPYLPLGARDIFMEELRRIHGAKERLSNPRLASRIDEEARSNLELAEEILSEIIDKAPRLLNLALSSSKA